MSSIVSWLFGAAPVAQGNPLDDRYYDAPAQGALSSAGVRVTTDSAMRVAAVYACVRILANALAVMFPTMYERLERGRRKAPEHPLDPIIALRPNRRQNAFTFWRQICMHLVLRQNAYAQIVPGIPGRGWVGGLIPLHPDRIRGPEELSDGRLRYEYTRPSGEKVKLIGDVDVWHMTGLSDDGLRGLSMVDIAGNSIGVSLAAEKHAARFFDRGVKLSGILQHDRTLKPETAEAMSDSFHRKWGGEQGVGGVPVLWEGMKFQPVAMTLRDAEFLDSRKYSVSEIARLFGVPPHMIGDVERSTSWGTGIEQQTLQFLVYSLLPWIELIEQSINFTLVVQADRYYAKMNQGKLLRLDQKTQADIFHILLSDGILNPNECRELLDRNPRKGGDEYADAKKPAALPPVLQDSSPQDPPEEEKPNNARALSVARALAGARAADLLREEGDALRGLGRDSAKSNQAWRSAVAGFYGRFGARVATAMACSAPVARAWCETRRGLVLAGGLAGLDDAQGAAANLAQLALMEAFDAQG